MSKLHVVPVRRREVQRDDDLHMAYLNAKVDNRKMSATLEELCRRNWEQVQKRETKKRLMKECAKALGLSLVAIGCIASAIACDFSNAPWWTVFAPLTLLVLTFRKL